MNHQKIYDAIIQKAKFENRIKGKGKYYEKHHIFPKCLGGSNDKNNLVLLTAKEHFICHKLLTYIHAKNRKIACAYYYMTFNKRLKINLSLRDYAYAKELLHTIPVSKETKLKMRLSSLGKKHPHKGYIQSEETKEKRAKKHRGRKNTKETIKKMSLAAKGKTKNYDVWNKNKMTINITPEIIGEINDLYKKGKYQHEIAKMYNFSPSCVSRILKGFYDNKIYVNSP